MIQVRLLIVLSLLLQFNISFADKKEIELIHKSFINAAHLGDLEAVKLALDDSQINIDYQYYPNVTCRNDIGPTALIEAATNAHTEIVKFLLNKGANPNIVDKTGMLDVYYYDYDIYDHEYTFDYFDKCKGGYTALIHATKKGHTEIVKLLLDAGADPNIQDVNGNTALILAAEYSLMEITNLLLNKGANPNIKKNKKDHRYRRDMNDWTALIWAAYKGNVDIVKLLLNAKADPNIQDQYGSTALIESVIKGRKDIAKLLLNAKANPNMKTKDGGSALLAAAYNGYVDIVKELLDRNNYYPKSRLFQFEIVKRIYSYLNLIDLNIKNNDGITPLMWAANRGYVEIAELLINYKADLNIQSKFGDTALIWAANNGYVDIAKLLVDAKANLDFQNENGSTALMLAADKGHKEIVKLLLDAGADSNIKDNNNRTVLARLRFAYKADDIVQLIKNR